jgi:UDP-N-acetylmuramate dehydrogenase
VLVDDAGLRNLVVVNRAADVFELDGERIRAASGLSLSAVVERAAREGLTGLEFAAGIPGSFGGGLVGNAGAWGKALGDIFVDAEVVDRQGDRRIVAADECEFEYRNSALLQRGDVVLTATLQMRRGDPQAIRAEMDANLAKRAARHPSADVPTAGSFFKNVQPTSAAERRTAAGFYLERAGAKTLRVGGAAVSEKHANIVVNAGGARASDVLALTTEMQRRVRDLFHIELQPEVRYIRPDDHL